MLEMLWKFVSWQFERWTLRLRWKIWELKLKKLKLVRHCLEQNNLHKIHCFEVTFPGVYHKTPLPIWNFKVALPSEHLSSPRPKFSFHQRILLKSFSCPFSCRKWNTLNMCFIFYNFISQLGGGSKTFGTPDT